MVTLKEVLSDAQRRRIAIGHFNVSDLVGLKAVTGAAEILNVPVLVGTSEGERNFLGVHKIRGRSSGSSMTDDDKSHAPMRKTHRVMPRPPFERIALVLQGGGALGAYQAGVYQALAEANLRPDWVAGISIGAINAALIAGNPPEKRVERLRDFWETVSAAPAPIFTYIRSMEIKQEWIHTWLNQIRALSNLFGGAPGFFKRLWCKLLTDAAKRSGTLCGLCGENCIPDSWRGFAIDAKLSEFELTFPDPMDEFNAGDGDRGAPKALQSKHWTQTKFDRSMVLLYQII